VNFTYGQTKYVFLRLINLVGPSVEDRGNKRVSGLFRPESSLLVPSAAPTSTSFYTIPHFKMPCSKTKFAGAQKTIVGTADSGSYTIWTSEPHDAAEEEKLVAQMVQERIEWEDRMLREGKFFHTKFRKGRPVSPDPSVAGGAPLSIEEDDGGEDGEGSEVVAVREEEIAKPLILRRKNPPETKSDMRRRIESLEITGAKKDMKIKELGDRIRVLEKQLKTKEMESRIRDLEEEGKIVMETLNG
jgi:uncharacterized coiled-coil protein SlyX